MTSTSGSPQSSSACVDGWSMAWRRHAVSPPLSSRLRPKLLLTAPSQPARLAAQTCHTPALGGTGTERWPGTNFSARNDMRSHSQPWETRIRAPTGPVDGAAGGTLRWTCAPSRPSRGMGHVGRVNVAGVRRHQSALEPVRVRTTWSSPAQMASTPGISIDPLPLATTTHRPAPSRR